MKEDKYAELREFLKWNSCQEIENWYVDCNVKHIQLELIVDLLAERDELLREQKGGG